MPTKPKTEPAAPAAPEVEEEDLEQYEQNRLELLARLGKVIEERGKPEDIISKLALITGLVGQVKKTGKNTFHNYRYAKEGDLVEAIRPLLAALGIRVHESLYGNPEQGFVAHERRSQIKGKGGDAHEAETLTVITMVFWFEHWNEKLQAVEKTEPQYFMGYGDDSGDKGIYKALTGTVKYFLMKSFMVATGDDPEGDTRADQRAAGRDAQTQVQVRSSQRPATGHGGRQATPSSPQIKQLGELLRAKGVKKSEDVLTWLGEKLGQPFAVEDGDPATTLSVVLTTLPADTVGKLVAGLRAEANGTGEMSAADPSAGDDAAASGDREQAESVAIAADEQEDAGPIV